MERYLAAVVQMDTSADWETNLNTVANYIRKAAQQGAKLVAFPEHFACYEGQRTPSAPVKAHPTVQCIQKAAAENGIWVLGGSLFTPAADGRNFNTSVLIDPMGEISAIYHKLHLFDISLTAGRHSKESKHTAPGNQIISVPTQLGKLGMSVCYDLRFPELYRLMALQGTQGLLAPALFAQETGKGHRETLVRCRAIENGCYVIAPNQWGGSFQAWGHSMIVDPWGKVLCEIPEGPGMALAEIDLNRVEQIRREMPCLDQRRTDLYQISQCDG